MAIVINGSGTVTGISVGGLPDNIVDSGTLASNSGTLTEVDQWRMTSDFATAASGSFDITDNWARSSGSGAGSLGTGMTESSGVFTFPSTGYWLIQTQIQFSKDDGICRHTTNYLNTTINNSDYNAVSNCNGGIWDSDGSGYANVHTQFIFDVTSTTDCKCKLRGSDAVDTEVTLKGNSGLDETAIKFIRLGDT